MNATTILRTGMLALVVSLLQVAPGYAQPPGQREIDEVTEAYGQTQQYHGVTQYTAASRQGAFDNRRTGEIRVAFDRASGRLLIDDPDYHLVIVDGKLLARPHVTPHLHIEQPMSDALSWDAVVRAMPIAEQRPPVDLVLALDDDPVDTLTGGVGDRATRLSPDPEDPQQRPRLQLRLPAGQMTLVVNAQNTLVDKALIELGQPDSPRASAYVYDVTIAARNQPLADELFAFDTTGSQAMADIGQLMQAMSAGGGGGASGAGAGGAPPHQAMRLPDLELPTLAGGVLKLSEIESPTVVLAFFTTWAPGSIELVKEIETLRDWAEEQKQPVRVLLVSIYEPADQVRKVLDGRNVQSTVIIDEQGQLAGAARVLTVPQVILFNKGDEVGRAGDVANLAETLKQQITALPVAPARTLETGDQP